MADSGWSRNDNIPESPGASEGVVVEGFGLHSGAAARVVVRRCEGPVRIGNSELEACIHQFEAVSTERATTIEVKGGALRVATVEHALAALAGMGIYDGAILVVAGPEMPILDGGASAWCDAIARLAIVPTGPRLRVVREAAIAVGKSRYELAPNTGTIDLEVCLELEDPRVDRVARWHGDRDDFRFRIAPARTFATARDVEDLARRGLARYVDPASVVVLAEDAIHFSGRPFSPDEPARHKLLDLIGDFYLRGGPPLGRIRALRPGHAATARALQLAVEQGVLAPI
jgi:UDP-3-O-[3-hydroxymyristoyl] N-acetylglucosamine deacetylase